ncbi:MAG: CDC27 family protein [Bacteroidales bacterium]|nr:CDC27 family protein [Bacteroidales bacterium]
MSEGDNAYYIDESGHLTGDGVSQCAEFMLVKNTPNGELTSAVNDHIENCELCRNRVIELYEIIRDEPAVLNRIKENYQQKGNDTPSHRRLRSGKGWINLTAAAIFLAIIIIAAYYIFTNPNPQKIFSEHFNPYPNIITTKSDQHDELTQAMLYYDVHDYDSAAVMLEEVLVDDRTNVKAMFYLGNCYLAMSQSQKALHWFKTILESESTELFLPSKWYLALAYIKQDKIDKAKPLLKDLGESKGSYREKAKRILERIP